jgi:integrase
MANIICESWEQAEREAAQGEISQDRIAAILNETLQRCGIKPVESPRVGDWLKEWLQSKTQVAPATQRSYRQAVTEFLEYLGEAGARRRLEAITEKDVAGFIAALRKSGRIPSTVNNIRRHLSIPFEKARKLGKIKFNPVMATDSLKQTVAVKETFSPEQIARLLTVASNDWAGCIIAGYTIGARLMDIANLKWSNLDTENGVISFTQAKTGRATLIGMHEDFTDWLANQSVPEQPDAFVFKSLAGRDPSGRKGLSTEFSSIMEQAGVAGKLIRQASGGKSRNLSGLSFHSLRHGSS